MIFHIVLAVLLFFNYGSYGVSGEAFLIYAHKAYPEINGTCYYAVCEKSTHGVTFDCFKKHTENGKVLSGACGLELKENSKDEFWKTDGEGRRTGESAKAKKYGDVFILHRTDLRGNVNAVLCGTYSGKITEETEKVIDEKCKFEGVTPQKINNDNC